MTEAGGRGSARVVADEVDEIGRWCTGSAKDAVLPGPGVTADTFTGSAGSANVAKMSCSSRGEQSTATDRGAKTRRGP